MEPVSSKVCSNDEALLRRPAAWLHHPVVTLEREEEGSSTPAVIVDCPHIPPWRVFYVRHRTALNLVGTPRLGEYLSERCLYVDYRTLTALLRDGWRVV